MFETYSQKMQIFSHCVLFEEDGNSSPFNQSSGTIAIHNLGYWIGQTFMNHKFKLNKWMD